jgi:hypothetical protein
MVQIACRKVVVTLLAEALDKTCRVAGVGVCHAVADLLPFPRSTLAAAARSEEVVVQFVVTGGVRTVEDGHGCSFQTDDNSLVGLVREDVPSQSVLLPAKIFGIVEAASNLLPLSCTMLVCVCVVCHPREAQDRLFIGNVRTRYLIIRPCR